MKVHDLKTWPDVFQAVWDGDKTAEFRRDDRGFEVGDQLRLNEWNPETGLYTSRAVVATVSHVTHGGRFCIPAGHVILSMKDAIQWGPSSMRELLRDLLESTG